MSALINFICIGSKAIVTFLDTGESIEKDPITDQEVIALRKATTKEDIYSIINPEYSTLISENMKIKDLIEKASNSPLLIRKAESFYFKDIPYLSLPQELILAILQAEEAGNQDALTAYHNFWTLMTLNPNEQCQKNLFWYLKNWGMKIAKCGFFVGYRNVDSTDNPDVYTDHHSHSFRIEIGKMVTMDRSKCDPVQENQCSEGLHLSNVGWLKNGYFGTIGLACLCNPANVVAVPYDSSYGKLRTCAYLPIAKVNYDQNEDVIPLDLEDGFDCSYVSKVIYEGLHGTKEDSPYRIVLNNLLIDTPEKTQIITDKLLQIALECITNKVVK